MFVSWITLPPPLLYAPFNKLWAWWAWSPRDFTSDDIVHDVRGCETLTPYTVPRVCLESPADEAERGTQEFLWVFRQRNDCYAHSVWVEMASLIVCSNARAGIWYGFPNGTCLNCWRRSCNFMRFWFSFWTTKSNTYGRAVPWLNTILDTRLTEMKFFVNFEKHCFILSTLNRTSLLKHYR